MAGESGNCLKQKGKFDVSSGKKTETKQHLRLLGSRELECVMRPTLVLMKTLQRWWRELGRAPQESPPRHTHMQDASLIMLVVAWEKRGMRMASGIGGGRLISLFFFGGARGKKRHKTAEKWVDLADENRSFGCLSGTFLATNHYRIKGRETTNTLFI